MAGLYLHIPFCHSKCAYCDFYSMGNTGKAERLIDALGAEYLLRQDETCDADIDTVYFGGGTPSIIDTTLMGRLMTRLPLDQATEITLEANPEDVNARTLDAWLEMGINRISMGVQSMVDAELAIIGRRHSAAQACNAANAMRNAGLTNYNLDLIYGLPGQNLESWKYSVERLLSLNPTHISAYSLTYEPRTRLSAMLRQGIVQQTDEDTVIALYRYICDTLRQAGYEHYEISNWAKPGHRAAHNSNYWNGTPYLGLGPSAHSYDGDMRRINPANLTQYLQCIESGHMAYDIEPEDADNIFNDMLITRLRTADGLDLSNMEEARHRQLMRDAKPFISDGKLILSDGRLTFDEDSWLVSDYVLERLIQLS